MTSKKNVLVDNYIGFYQISPVFSTDKKLVLFFSHFRTFHPIIELRIANCELRITNYENIVTLNSEL